jgi:hypothetical protein
MSPRSRVVTALSLIATLVVASPRSLKAERLTEAEFRKLLDELRPDHDEPWRTVPWKIALLDAQRLAAAKNQPIFIWAMDGHPLGCT